MKGFIETTIDFIEEHIEEDLSADIISKHIGYSKYYLQRHFGLYTGMGLIEYVRQRKLNHSLYALYRGDRILDIGIRYGYSSERAYSRAFSSEFKKSPRFIRNNPILSKPPFKVRELKIRIRKELEMLKDYLSDVSYTTIKAMKVVSVICDGSQPEDEANQKLSDFLEVNNIEERRRFGFDSPVQTDNPELYRAYEAWCVLPEDCHDFVMDEGLLVKEIQSCRYVTLTIKDPFADPFERIGGGWKALVSWIEDHKVAVDDTLTQCQCLEELIDQEGHTTMKIYIPVEKK